MDSDRHIITVNPAAVCECVAEERKRIHAALEALPRYLAVSQPHDGVPIEKEGPHQEPHLWGCWFVDAVNKVIDNE